MKKAVFLFFSFILFSCCIEQKEQQENENANGKEYQPVRYEGTYSQALFDAIVYDPNGRTATRINFGNRPDNIFEFTDNGIVHTENVHQQW